MVAGFDDKNNVNGGPERHIPVLLNQVIQALEPNEYKTIFDGTFGAGGYSKALMAKGAKVVATDQDPDVIEAAQPLLAQFTNQLELHHAKFSQILDFADEGSLDGVVLDIGVSSMQIDEGERGFSFMKSGPLDMRMSQSGVSAADVVNQLKASDLARIFGFYGEEKKSGRIARAIEAARADAPFLTTGQLADFIAKVSPRKAKDKIHPATRVFQALRIFVNDELSQLADALFAAELALKPGGRLVIVTFHSLEDRIVKKFFSDRFGLVSGSRHLPQVEKPAPSFEKLGHKLVVQASDEEISQNVRARSAKLRAGIRTTAPQGSAGRELFNLPDLFPIQKISGKV